MVWADERPIDRPRVRKARPELGEIPGWMAIVDYDSGTRTETWQSWRDAADRALVAAGTPEEAEAALVEAVERYRAVVPVLDVYGEAAS
jgi:hypothetical protein